MPKTDPPEGIRIPDGLDRAMTDICNCGSGESWALILEVLEVCEAHAEHLAATRGKPCEPSDTYPGTWIGDSREREFVMHYLGSWRIDLLEHGSSVNGSWLTKKGEAALEFLREHIDALDSDGPPEFYNRNEVYVA